MVAPQLCSQPTSPKLSIQRRLRDQRPAQRTPPHAPPLRPRRPLSRLPLPACLDRRGLTAPRQQLWSNAERTSLRAAISLPLVSSYGAPPNQGMQRPPSYSPALTILPCCASSMSLASHPTST